MKSITFHLLTFLGLSLIAEPIRAELPITTVSDGEGISGFELYGKGVLWWDFPVCSGDIIAPGAIRSRGLIGSAATQRTHADSCDIVHTIGLRTGNSVRDDAYVYYFSQGRLYRKALNAAQSDGGQLLTAVPALPSGELSAFLELADGYLYWSAYTSANDDFTLYRINPDPAAGDTPHTMGSSSSGGRIIKMEFFKFEDSAGSTYGALLWLQENGNLSQRVVNSHYLTGVVRAVGVNDFALHTRKGYLPNGLNSPILREYTFIYAAKRNYSGSLTSAAPPGTVWRINADTDASTVIYTAYGHNQVVSVGADRSASPAIGAARKLYLAEGPIAGCGGLTGCHVDTMSLVIRRHTAPGAAGQDYGDWDLIVATRGGINLRSDDDRLYFLNSPSEGQDLSRIQSISTGAPALEIDAQALGLEVVQTVQSLNNDVFLVARRQAFVRGYAHLPKNTTDISPWLLAAKLEGWRNGVSLGAAVYSLNSAQVSAESELGKLRSSADRSFLFELPENWTEAGTLTLKMTVDPDPKEVPETDVANNTVTATAHFVAKGSPTLVFVPLSTTAGIHHPSDAMSDFKDILERASSLLPIWSMSIEQFPGVLENTKTEWEAVCYQILLPPFIVCPVLPVTKKVPFDMASDDDQTDALDALQSLAKFDTRPDLHYIGMVPSSAPKFAGVSYPNSHVLAVRMRSGPAHDDPSLPDWNNPWGGRSLAHEMGHNYGRQHINCGNPPPEQGIDSVPFDPCTLGPTDLADPDTYFGFDPITHLIIKPTDAADLMSYSASRWPTPFTWNTLFDITAAGDAAGGAAGDAGGGQPIPAGSFLLVHGKILPAQNLAKLKSFSIVTPMLVSSNKIAASLRESDAAARSINPYFIRLLDSTERILANVPLATRQAEDGGAGLGFSQFVPFNAATRRIQLVQGTGVLAERVVSAHAPTLALAPVAFDAGNQTLTLAWTASDADADTLLFAIQYSGDDGATWQALSTDYPALGLTLSTRQLKGGLQARLRVIATDGVNTATATTPRFNVARHAPTVFIGRPGEGQRIPFGQIITLRGSASDLEQGSLPSGSLRWTLTGPTSLNAIGSCISVPDAAPGSYTVTLSATDADNMTGTATRHFEVLPLRVPEGAAPRLDGRPHDQAYAEGTFLRVPLGNGEFARAWLVHSGSNLFASFTGLKYGLLGANAKIGLRFDGNASRMSATTDDVGFFVDEDGIPFQEIGARGAMMVTTSPKQGFKAVIERGAGSWSAEFRIADSLLGGWDHAVGLMIDHGTPHWPPPATDHSPATWAAAYLGTPPAPANRPPVAEAGPDRTVNVAAPTVVSLDGSGSFDPDGDALTYVWTQVAGPSVTLSNAATVATSFVAAPTNAPVVVRFRLTVRDNQITSPADEVTMTLAPTAAQMPSARSTTVETKIVNGRFYGRLWAQPGERYAVQASSDLVNWTTLSTHTVDFNGMLDFIDGDIALYPMRFYRVVK